MRLLIRIPPGCLPGVWDHCVIGPRQDQNQAVELPVNIVSGLGIPWDPQVGAVSLGRGLSGHVVESDVKLIQNLCIKNVIQKML